MATPDQRTALLVSATSSATDKPRNLSPVTQEQRVGAAVVDEARVKRLRSGCTMMIPTANRIVQVWAMFPVVIVAGFIFAIAQLAEAQRQIEAVLSGPSPAPP